MSGGEGSVRALATLVSAKVVDTALLRARASLELCVAIRRTHRFGGVWNRYTGSRFARLRFTTFSEWYKLTLKQGPLFLKNRVVLQIHLN